ncbi:GNAT family N-acetyltransferase [Paludifilum halophilum]|uniref:GNAT family N-acetyltransferase n=1 Tax=Paludifilum halophilum TaxID=1642702 RepID=A0A235B4T1_9BACL|nr:GNAT family N-acetyltransferase [Paludifilum halophilum]OYD07318.1 GNAT family N-acetyltransferase [Paludifilum halophilum]
MDHSDVRIVELTTEAEWRRAYPVMSELRPYLEEEGYLRLLREMRKEGYRLFALLEGDEIAAVAGVTVWTTFYYGRHVFVYDLVTQSDRRSRGYGRKLLNHVERWAEERGCERVALSSNQARKEAHRFYEEKMGYRKPSYQFVKEL